MILEAFNIDKKYGEKQVLNKVSFSVQRGRVLGIIGPNGSGKTTLLNIIIDSIHPDNGYVVNRLRDKTGVAISKKGFFQDMSVKKNLEMYASLMDIPRCEVDRATEMFLIDFKDQKFRELSSGMKQRVSLACAFMSQPELILLDEPTNNLDVDTILLTRSIISDHKAKGVSFLITSHILTDLERVCDEVVFIKSGNVIKTSSLELLLERYSSLEKAYVQLLNPRK